MNKETIKHVAKLARIKLTDKEAEEFSKDFEKILEFFGKIDRFKTPQKFEYKFIVTKTVRNDKVRKEKDYEDVLKNAPAVEKNYIKTWRIV